MYAINIADLTKDKDGVWAPFLIGPVSGQAVEAEKRFDGMALTLACDEERAQAIVEVIRLKYKKHEMRCYQSKTGKGGWKRI